MKSQLVLLVITFFVLATFSCKKSVETNGLTGKWKLTEQYDGYANGGNFQWNKIPSGNSHILTFTSDGKYTKNEISNTNQNSCSGTFVFYPDNKLEINSTCNIMTERAFVSELTSTTLVLDRSGIEGVIRYKYSSIK